MKILKNSPQWVLTLSLLSLSYITYAKADTGNLFNVQSTKSHELTILNNGLAALEKRLELIERAKKSIDVEYFIYRTDTSAKIFTQALVKKAREGVKVRILLDTFMVINDLSPFYAHEIEKEGIEIKYFNTAGPLNLAIGGYRNHRKLLSIDGEEAITGGRNIGDEYFDLSSEYNFLDRDMYIKGEIVKSIENTFDQFFASDISAHLERPAKPDRLSYSNSTNIGQSTIHAVNSYAFDIKKWETKVKAAQDFIATKVDDAETIRASAKINLSAELGGVCNKLSFHSEYPFIGQTNRLTNRVIKQGIFERIKNAKKSILMESPYFIMNNELRDALDTALTQKNKIDVRLLTNSLNSTDATYVYAIFDSNIIEWIDKGLVPFIFKAKRPDSYSIIGSKAGDARFGVHAKTFVFDDKDIIIGTYNVDPRSANYNSEMIMVCEDSKELAKIVSDNIEVRIHESFQLKNAQDVHDLEFYETSFSKRISYYLEKFPANAFSYLF